MKKETVKKVFIFFLIYLPFQYGAVGVIGHYKAEPWPAFVLPAFKSSGSAGEPLTFNAPHFIAMTNRSSIKLDNEKLFRGLSNSQRAVFFRDHFFTVSQLNALNAPARRWLNRQIERILPNGEHVESLKVKWLQTTITPFHKAAKKSTSHRIKSLSISF